MAQVSASQLELWLGLAWLSLEQVRSQVKTLLDVSNFELCKFQININWNNYLPEWMGMAEKYG